MKETKSIICNEIKDFGVFEEVLKDLGFKELVCRRKDQYYLYVLFRGNGYWYDEKEDLKIREATKLNYKDFVWEFLKNFCCAFDSYEDKIWIAKQLGNNNPYIASHNKFCFFQNDNWCFGDIAVDDRQLISFKNFQKLINSINEMKSPKYYITLKNIYEKKAFLAYLEEYKAKNPQIKARIVPNTFFKDYYVKFRICNIYDDIFTGSTISDNIAGGYTVLTFAEIEKFMKSLLDFYNKSEFVFSAGFKAVYNEEKKTITIVEKERKLEFWREFTKNLLCLNENIVISGLDISKKDMLEFKHWMMELSSTNL